LCETTSRNELVRDGYNKVALCISAICNTGAVERSH